jgi:hypothetical protein
LLLKSVSILKQIATKESIHTKPQKTNYIVQLFSILMQIATKESIHSCSSSIEQNRLHSHVIAELFSNKFELKAWGGGSYTCANGLAGDRGPSQNREWGGGHRLGWWWPSGIGHRLDPAGGGEGIWACRGGVGLEEDMMGTSGWRRTSWAGQRRWWPEASTTERGWQLGGEDGGRAHGLGAGRGRRPGGSVAR